MLYYIILFVAMPKAVVYQCASSFSLCFFVYGFVYECLLGCGRETASSQDKNEGYRCADCGYRIVYKKRTPKSMFLLIVAIFIDLTILFVLLL